MSEKIQTITVSEFLTHAPFAPFTDGANGHHAGAFDRGTQTPFDAKGQISIDTSNDHLPTLNRLCWAAIQKGNEPPIMFRFGNTIVRTALNDKGAVWLQPVSPEIMRHHLSNWAHWHKNQMRFVKPPIEVIRDVLATLYIDLPALSRIVAVPVFAADGSLRAEPGYNAASGVLYAPEPGFTALPVPDQISAEDVAAANRLLCEDVLGDFPFALTSDRDNAVALFLLPFARDLIDGPTPNHLIEASMPASGKGKLVQALLGVSVGRDLGLLTPVRDDDEWRKQITSALIVGRQVILIDNVVHRLDSSALAAAWTADIWDDRIVGYKEKANMPVRCIWVMTGNNVAVSTELARRCLRIRIQPATDRPEELDHWRHPDLLPWCAEHRAELVRAAHVIIRWWIQQGMPAAKFPRPLGSYERWTRVMGGILEAAGYTQFLTNYREFQGRADTERSARALFCATWYDWTEMPGCDTRREGVSTSDLVPIAEGIEGLPIRGESPRALQSSLGRWLKTNSDVFVEHQEEIAPGQTLARHFRIVIGKVRQGKQQWVIEMHSKEVLKVLDS